MHNHLSYISCVHNALVFQINLPAVKLVTAELIETAPVQGFWVM